MSGEVTPTGMLISIRSGCRQCQAMRLAPRSTGTASDLLRLSSGTEVTGGDRLPGPVTAWSG